MLSNLFKNELISKLSYISEVLFGMIIHYSCMASAIRFYCWKSSKVPIIMYHSISDNFRPNQKSCLSLMGMVVTKRTFEKHIRYIVKRYTPITVEEVVESYSQTQHLPKNPIVVSFDDGLRDNYTNAFPILKKYNCDATVFVVGNRLKASSLIDLHQFYDILDASDIDAVAKVNLIQEFKMDIMTGNRERISEIFNKLRQNLGLPEKSEMQTDYLSAEEIAEMQNGNISFGAHSMGHYNLAQLPHQDLEYEVMESLSLLRNITEQNRISFAYPFGHQRSWNDVVIETLKKYGASCGCTTVEGLNTPHTNIYTLRRIEINDISIYALIFRITGIRATVKNIFRKLLNKR